MNAFCRRGVFALPEWQTEALVFDVGPHGVDGEDLVGVEDDARDVADEEGGHDEEEHERRPVLLRVVVAAGVAAGRRAAAARGSVAPPLLDGPANQNNLNRDLLPPQRRKGEGPRVTLNSIECEPKWIKTGYRGDRLTLVPRSRILDL